MKKSVLFIVFFIIIPNLYSCLFANDDPDPLAFAKAKTKEYYINWQNAARDRDNYKNQVEGYKRQVRSLENNTNSQLLRELNSQIITLNNTITFFKR